MTDKRETLSSALSTDAASQNSPSASASIAKSPRPVVRDQAKKWPTTVAEFDQMFDAGENLDHLIDWAKPQRATPPTP